jgi:hypothetical protein
MLFDKLLSTYFLEEYPKKTKYTESKEHLRGEGNIITLSEYISSEQIEITNLVDKNLHLKLVIGSKFLNILIDIELIVYISTKIYKTQNYYTVHSLVEKTIESYEKMFHLVTDLPMIVKPKNYG